MIQIRRAYALVDNFSEKSHAFSILATDNGFSYIFGTYSGAQFFDPALHTSLVMDYARNNNLLPAHPGCQDYSDIATIGFGYFAFDAPFTVQNSTTATRAEQVDIDSANASNLTTANSVQSVMQSARANQVFQDFPDLEEQLMSTDPNNEITSNGMTALVLSILGSIDPDGPNGWLLNDSDSQSSASSGVIVANESQFDSTGMPISTGDDE